MLRTMMIAAAVVMVGGCETSDDEVARSARVPIGPGRPNVGATVPAEQLDLRGTAALIENGDVKDGTQLETRINRDTDNRVDVDRDGKRDRLQVVERPAPGDGRTFEVRAIPSSRAKADADEVGVAVARIEVERAPEVAHVTVAYTDAVVVIDPVVIRFDAPIVVGSFCHWVLVVDRPLFIGIAYVVVVEPRHVDFKHKKHKHKHKHKKW
jgi:hypothetical protein